MMGIGYPVQIQGRRFRNMRMSPQVNHIRLHTDTSIYQLKSNKKRYIVDDHVTRSTKRSILKHQHCIILMHASLPFLQLELDSAR